MDSDWLKFFELVERLQSFPPGLVELALRYRKNQGAPGDGRQSESREVLHEVERELGKAPRASFFQGPDKVNLARCQEFLGGLRKEEAHLRERQEETARELLQVQAARRAFEEALKEMLRAERRPLAPEEWAELLATEEEVVAGLQELNEHGGSELHEFIGELEQALHDRERAGK
jgi:hypothetical protein